MDRNIASPGGAPRTASRTISEPGLFEPVPCPRTPTRSPRRNVPLLRAMRGGRLRTAAQVSSEVLRLLFPPRRVAAMPTVAMTNPAHTSLTRGITLAPTTAVLLSTHS